MKLVPMTLRATLFDMDGLLIDSEPLWHEAEIDIVGGLGIARDLIEARPTKGLFVGEAVAHWYAEQPWTGPSQDDVAAMILNRVGDLVAAKGTLMPGALEAVALAKTYGPVAVASSTPLALIHRNLDHFGITTLFDAILSAEFESHGKPHPAVFLAAARALEVPAPACLVFEDSAAGVIAARAGRMRVVAVPAVADRLQPAFALAEVVLDSLEQLDPRWLAQEFGHGAVAQEA